MRHYEPKTISEAGMTSQEYFVVHIGDAFSNKTISDDTLRTKNSELWFFQVADRSELLYAPYQLLDDSGTSIGAIGSQSGTNYQRLFDASGDDILRIEDFNFRVYHYSLGVQQDEIRIYPRIPDNQNGGAWDWLSGSEPDPTAGDPYGYIPGERTDYYDPDISLEAVSWETSSRSPIQYGFYNESTTKDIEPVLSVRGHAYELRPVEQREEKLAILAELGRPPGKRDIAVRSVEYSGTSLRAFAFDPPNDWQDAQNNLQVQRVNLPDAIEENISENGETVRQQTVSQRGGNR